MQGVNDRSTSVEYYMLKLIGKVENFLIPIMAFFAPIYGILGTVVAFIFLDTLTGIWKCKKNKIPVTSRGLSAIITKTLLYELFIIGSFFIDKYILGDITQSMFSVDLLVVKLVALTAISIEIKSINQNYKAVRGIDLWKEFRNLLSRIKETKQDIKDTTKN